MGAPCLYCTREKELGCHSRCDNFKEFRNKRDLINKKRREYMAYPAYVSNARDRMTGKRSGDMSTRVRNSYSCI